MCPLEGRADTGKFLVDQRRKAPMVDHMKRRLVSVRPRVGSALERLQTTLDNDMADKLHELAAKDEAGWNESFALRKTGEKEDE